MARGASGAAARGTSAVLAAAAEPGTTTVTAPVAAPAGPSDEPYVFPPLFGVSTVNQVINAHKVTSIMVFAAACVLASNFQLPALMYTALHGAYGLCWCSKYLTTPDKSFETPVNSVGEFAVAYAILNVLYWTGGLVMIATGGSNRLGGVALGWPADAAALVSGGAYGVQVAVATFAYTIGMYLHFAGDAQKFFTLKYKPRALITEGLFSRSRNINYLGEMLIYSAFALVANNAWLVLANLLMWTTLFRANMMKKDASLSRYPGFAEYKERSNLLLPKLFGRGDSDDGAKKL